MTHKKNPPLVEYIFKSREGGKKESEISESDESQEDEEIVASDRVTVVGDWPLESWCLRNST